MMEKTIRHYGKVYRKALSFRCCRDIEEKAAAYEARLREMYASKRFKAHSVYPTTNAASYENLRRHVTFIRHSDLSDGDACHDEIIRRRKAQ